MPLPDLIPIEDLFADPVFAGASISPDGTRLAYLAPRYGRTQVWIRGIDDDHDRAVCVTHDRRRGVKQYFWTGDPRWLVYLQDTDGDEDWHLHRVDLDDPEAPAVDLTPLPRGGRVFAVQPLRSDPGSVMVAMNVRPMHFDLFAVHLASGETILLHEVPDDRTTIHVDPDGRAAFWTSIADDGSWRIHAVDAETGARRLVRTQGGPEHPIALNPVRVSPDGQGLYVGGYQDDGDDLCLLRVDRATGETTVVAALDGHSVCTMGAVMPTLPPPLLVSRRTQDVLAVRFVGGRPVVQPVDPGFAEVLAELEALSDGVIASASSDVEERRWVVSFIHDREPGRTFLYDRATGGHRLLGTSHPQLDPEQLAPMVAVDIMARDGLPLHAFLTLPVGVDPTGLPLVLKVHGGPWCHDQWGFDPQIQFLANRGYAVLQVNFRGSSGYGRRHITAAIGEFAGAMHDDLIDASDWAVKQGYADPTRIGIYGGSYGGYAALVGVTFTPDHFAAAVDYVGVSDLANFMRGLPAFVRPRMVNSWFLYVGDPDDPEQEAEMLARSPITRADDIRTPLLVVQGANDTRVVQAESDNIVASLRRRGVPVEYLLAEDEGHGFQNHENLVAMFRAIERHFATHLGGRS